MNCRKIISAAENEKFMSIAFSFNEQVEKTIFTIQEILNACNYQHRAGEKHLIVENPNTQKYYKSVEWLCVLYGEQLNALLFNSEGEKEAIVSEEDTLDTEMLCRDERVLKEDNQREKARQQTNSTDRSPEEIEEERIRKRKEEVMKVEVACRLLDIPYYVVDDPKYMTVGHAWNIVLVDGLWCTMDLTDGTGFGWMCTGNFMQEPNKTTVAKLSTVYVGRCVDETGLFWDCADECWVTE